MGGNSAVDDPRSIAGVDLVGLRGIGCFCAVVQKTPARSILTAAVVVQGWTDFILGLQMLLKIAANSLPPIGAYPVEAVTLLRQEHKVKMLVRPDQRIDHLYGPREEQIVGADNE